MLTAAVPGTPPLHDAGAVARVRYKTVPRRSWRLARCGVLAAIGLVLASCTTLGELQQQEARVVTPIRVDAARAARLISAYRSANGLGPVRVDARLMRVAADYARVMGERDRIKHGLGNSLPSRTRAAGYDWGYVAENLAASYSTLEDTMQGWKDSTDHNKNLLGPYPTEMGIAAVSTPPGSNHRNYWALVLATPQPERLVARTAPLGGLAGALGVGGR